MSEINAASKLLVMAGGTGGHVFPGLACADLWTELGGEVCWVGTAKGIESSLVPAADITLNLISIEGVRGKGLLGLMTAPFKIVHAILQALGILLREKPDVILGMGGFAAGPGGIAAKLIGLPLIIHEQNAIAGTTNKLLSKVADQVMQAFPNAFPDDNSAITCGNPVRQEIIDMDKQYLPADMLNVLVIGGSLGALAINKMLPQVYKALAGHINLYHQTGKRHIESVNADYGCVSNNENLRIEAFIDDMPGALEWADLIICRSGAMTVSELAVAGRPAIFIPYPFAIDDHQTYNAQWLVNSSAAMVFQERDLDADVLSEAILSLNKDREKLQSMHENMLAAALSDASQIVVEQARKLIKQVK